MLTIHLKRTWQMPHSLKRVHPDDGPIQVPESLVKFLPSDSGVEWNGEIIPAKKFRDDRLLEKRAKGPDAAAEVKK